MNCGFMKTYYEKNKTKQNTHIPASLRELSELKEKNEETVCILELPASKYLGIPPFVVSLINRSECQCRAWLARKHLSSAYQEANYNQFFGLGFQEQ